MSDDTGKDPLSKRDHKMVMRELKAYLAEVKKRPTEAQQDDDGEASDRA